MVTSALTLPWQVLTAMFLLFLYKNGLIYSFIEPNILVDFAAGDLIRKKSLPKPKELVAKWQPSKNFNLEGCYPLNYSLTLNLAIFYQIYYTCLCNPAF